MSYIVKEKLTQVSKMKKGKLSDRNSHEFITEAAGPVLSSNVMGIICPPGWNTVN